MDAKETYKQGETVIDLGSGAGFDILTAAKKVGPSGRAIGVDMNKNMISKANANKILMNLLNVEFIESPITSIPLPDAKADCIISNCVINLVPASEKQLAFNEIFRLLKPGGRVAVSDILARKELPDDIRRDVALYVGCIAGASLVGEYEEFLKNAGFEDVLIVDTKSDLNVYFTANEAQSSCCKGADEDLAQNSSSCAPPRSAGSLETGGDVSSDRSSITDFNQWAGSFQIYAVKPGSA
ncbi:sam-dependent methyltransferase ubie/coq5 family protein [Fusarium flagelliforme]|uniref:Arsenite methyltransferase n=1 Tax=Fusarium flagelliforme TaxID=2675880 RepID=A0A395MRT5_9HYPO|nr:sam-dependent methyltransferase ubie/coq5 family protein [Fusarium flagelliforme]